MNRGRRIPPTEHSTSRQLTRRRPIENMDVSNKQQKNPVRRNKSLHNTSPVHKNVNHSNPSIKTPPKNIAEVLEVFSSDGIDITAVDRDYYVEAFILYMTAQMPPILSMLELPYELMATLEQLVLTSKEDLESNPSNQSPVTSDSVPRRLSQRRETPTATPNRIPQRRTTNPNNEAPTRRASSRLTANQSEVTPTRRRGVSGSTPSRNVKVRTSRTQRVGGNNEW